MSVSSARARLAHELDRLRLPDGSFPSIISPDSALQVDPRPCRSNFFLALTLSALHGSTGETSTEKVLASIREGLSRVIRAEQGPNGSFNYWMCDEPLRGTRPYPDDLDVTACAFASLSMMADEQARGVMLGTAVRILTSVETREGGPYRTWLVPEDADAVWKDVDVAVNANIAFFLSLHGIRLEPLDKWLGDRIRAGEYASPYYPFPAPVWYFLARGCAGDARLPLANDILRARQADGAWGNLLSTALAVSALGRLGASRDVITDGQAWLATRVQDSGMDALYQAFSLDSVTSGKPLYVGSPALTAALCLEALSTPVASPIVHVQPVANVVPSGDEVFFESVMDIVLHRADELTEPLRSRMRTWVERIVSMPRGREIPLLPYLFNACLASGAISDDRLRVLGAANVFGWVAYTIYDDVLDEEGDPQDLPVANICLRAVGAAYAKISSVCPPVAPLYRGVMDRMECANAWETTHARLTRRDGVVQSPERIPDYGDLSLLADRSYGHALGPLSMLLLAGHDPTSPEVKDLTVFFCHALIARQLDDDAHDWEEDLSAGRVNAVAAILFRAWQARGHRLEDLHMDDLTPLREFFWKDAIEEVVQTILHHVRTAESSLQSLSVLLKDDAPLRALIAPARLSADQALRGARETAAFVSAYRGKGSLH